MLLPDLGNPFFSQILAGIESVLTTPDLSVLITDASGIKQQQLVGYFQDVRADGVIILDGNIADGVLRELTEVMPENRVVFACEWKPGAELPSIRSDNRSGARQAIAHLFDLGHRKIGHVAGPRNNVLTKERLVGFEHAMAEFDIEVTSEWVIDGGEFSLEAGAQAARQFMEMDAMPTAIFCAADMIAMGLISEFASHGISVPKDVSVVGFDDIEIAPRFIPSLTTIRQNRLQLGVLAATTLMNFLSGRTTKNTDIISLVDVLLTPRESTAPIG